MKVYLLNYRFSTEDATITEKAEKFYNVVKEQLELYGVEYCLVSKQNYKKSISELGKESIIVLFNGTEINDEKFYEIALKNHCIIYPIALDKEHRIPHAIIAEKQSFDVYEQLRRRDLSEEYINIVAKVFARNLISICVPSIYQNDINLFLSHKRLDGEEIVANVCDTIQVLAPEKKVFRDVVNISVGETAQDIIDSALANSDILIFFHTEKSAESEWVLKELLYAITHNVPVLWIRIGNADINRLKYKPSEKPALEYSVNDFILSDKLKKVADEILDRSFALLMERGNDVYDDLTCIHNLFDDNISLLDNPNMIYTLSYPRKGYTYPQRKISQLIQFLGRKPKSKDIEKINSELDSRNYLEFDSAVILSKRIFSRQMCGRVLLDNYDDFYCIYQQYINGCETEKDGDIVISGAFPDGDEINKQSLIYALICFVKEILRNGYNLCFGAHPTFQELIFEIAKSITPNYREKVIMYISDLFVNETSMRKFADKCTPVNIASSNGDLSLSLTELRKKMINRDNVKALICLGGKIKLDKSKEGIREEIDIARSKGIPVFLIGSVGGCSAEIAKEYCVSGDWSKLNNATAVNNNYIANGIDYKSSAKKVLELIKNMEES